MKIILLENEIIRPTSSTAGQHLNKRKAASIFSYLLRVLGDCYAHSLFEEILRTRSNGISKPLLSKIILLRKMQDSRLGKLRYLGPVYANGKMYFATPFGVSSSLRNINDAIYSIKEHLVAFSLIITIFSVAVTVSVEHSG